MSLQLLFDHLDDLVRTPEDVARLEAAILDLAVRGKLVPQHENEEPAVALVERVVQEKRQLSSTSRGDSPWHPLVIEPDRAGYTLPVGWTWIRVGDLGIVNPRNQADGELLASFIPMNLINDGIGSGHSSETRSWKDIRSGFTHFAEGDIGVAKITPCFQNRKSTMFTGLTNNIGAGTTELHIFRPVAGTVLPQYALLYFQTSQFIDGGIASMTGTAGQQRVSRTYFEEALFPLPPLAEQRRIVAKVDELLAQTRGLAANLRRAQEEIVVVNQAALHRLETAGEGESLQAAWHTVAGSFDLLYADPRPLAGLRQAILQLAVRGKLVPQEEGDELTFSIEEIAEVQGGIQKSPSRRSGGKPVRYITVAHVQDGKIDPTDSRYFDLNDEEIRRWRLQAGDVLVVEGNGSAEHIGKAAIFQNEIEDCVYQNHLIRVRPRQDLILSEYLHLYLRSPAGRAQLVERSHTSSGLFNLSVGRLKTVAVPLPPLAEQRRIVAKVDALMAMCDALEQRLGQAEEVRQAAVESVLAHI